MSDSIDPDLTDPGWRDVKHDTKSLDCMGNDHAHCFVAAYCDCQCHEPDPITMPPTVATRIIRAFSGIRRPKGL